jgi:hypothetical protein
VLDQTKTGFVEVGTGVAVLIGFLWVMWCLVRPAGARVEKAGKNE